MKRIALAASCSLAFGSSACPTAGDEIGWWPHHGHEHPPSGDGDGSGDSDASTCDGGSSHGGTSDGGADAGGNGENPVEFSMRVLASGLYAPWEITWGPDNQLWITERVGHRVSRLDPESGAVSTLLWVTDAYTTSQHEGVLGMALHPDLLQGRGRDWVFIAYSYDADPGEPLLRRAKIRRYTYDASSASLVDPVDVITALPANNDHQGGRLKVGPDLKLYYTIGDQGANQFGNKCDPDLAQVLPTQAQVDAQDWSRYPGKTLRLSLDGSIPADNPVLDGVRSHIFTYGHRNPQGIVFGPNGTLYGSEQGPKTDDEVNILLSGKNYGWPYIAGYQDDMAYEYGNWSLAPDCEQLTYSDYELPPSVPRTAESAWSLTDFMPPIATFFTVPNGYQFHDPACAGGGEFVCWPTIAPPSIDIYTRADAIPGWDNSLLVPSLKNGSVYRLLLEEQGSQVRQREDPVFKTTNRYRDLALSPDQRTIYVITDNEGLTHAPNGGYTTTLENPGAVLAFTWQP